MKRNFKKFAVLAFVAGSSCLFAQEEPVVVDTQGTEAQELSMGKSPERAPTPEECTFSREARREERAKRCYTCRQEEKSCTCESYKERSCGCKKGTKRKGAAKKAMEE